MFSISFIHRLLRVKNADLKTNRKKLDKPDLEVLNTVKAYKKSEHFSFYYWQNKS
jgi:hypothetical protein